MNDEAIDDLTTSVRRLALRLIGCRGIVIDSGLPCVVEAVGFTSTQSARYGRNGVQVTLSVSITECHWKTGKPTKRQVVYPLEAITFDRLA